MATTIKIYEKVKEKLDILSDSETMRDIAEALQEYEKGKSVGFSVIKRELNLDV